MGTHFSHLGLSTRAIHLHTPTHPAFRKMSYRIARNSGFGWN